MEILRISDNKPSKDQVNLIVSFLSQGKIVVLPTETVYTFATDASNIKSIRRVYELKGRDFSKPLHVVVSSLTLAQKYALVTPNARVLAKHFLPGPLTLVLRKRKSSLPEILTSNLPTLGIRIPNLTLNLVIAKKFNGPYTTTSANISGGSNPYSIEEVLNQLDENKKRLIDLIVDVGVLPHLKPSTLIDLTSTPAQILREGPILKVDLEKIIGKIG